MILVYSITDEKSFGHMESWVQQVRDNGSSTANMILVAAKSDLEKDRRVSKKDGKQLAEKFGLTFLESSAKVNDNIDKVFENIANQVMQHARAEREVGEKLAANKKPVPQKEGCC